MDASTFKKIKNHPLTDRHKTEVEAGSTIDFRRGIFNSARFVFEGSRDVCSGLCCASLCCAVVGQSESEERPYFISRVAGSGKKVA